MCQIILNVGRNVLPKEFILNSLVNNDDAAGMVGIIKGKLVVKHYAPLQIKKKTYGHTQYTYYGGVNTKVEPEPEAPRHMLDADQIYKDYVKMKKDSNYAPLMFHTRIATSGLGIENTHPLLVSDDVAVTHNGTIYGYGSKADDGKSDTFEFNEQILKPLYTAVPNFFNMDIIGTLLKESIDNSKLAFLKADGTYCIVNEKAGEWDEEGNWYSNNKHTLSNNHKWNDPKVTSCDIKKKEKPSHIHTPTTSHPYTRHGTGVGTGAKTGNGNGNSFGNQKKYPWSDNEIIRLSVGKLKLITD